MLSKLKAKLQKRSGVTFPGWKTFRASGIQRQIDALVANGYKENAPEEAVMPWSRHLGSRP